MQAKEGRRDHRARNQPENNAGNFHLQEKMEVHLEGQILFHSTHIRFQVTGTFSTLLFAVLWRSLAQVNLKIKITLFKPFRRYVLLEHFFSHKTSAIMRNRLYNGRPGDIFLSLLEYRSLNSDRMHTMCFTVLTCKTRCIFFDQKIQ